MPASAFRPATAITNSTSATKARTQRKHRQTDPLDFEGRMRWHADGADGSKGGKSTNDRAGNSEKMNSQAGPLSQFGKGRIHPPSHMVTAIDETAIMAAYSASINSDQRKPLYSVWKPAVSSDSASGRSKGARLVSATMAMAKMIERDKAQREKLEDEPDVLLLLRLHDADHAQRTRASRVQAGHQERGNNRQPHGYFVGNHLSAGAQRADQRIVRIGGPAGGDNAEHAERRDAEHEQDADVHVGNGLGGAEGNDDVNREGRDEADDGRNPKNNLVGFGGNDVFLEHQLEGVGEGLQQAVRADAHGAEAHLDVGQRLALDPVHEPITASATPAKMMKM